MFNNGEIHLLICDLRIMLIGLGCEGSNGLGEKVSRELLPDRPTQYTVCCPRNGSHVSSGADLPGWQGMANATKKIALPPQLTALKTKKLRKVVAHWTFARANF